MSVRSVKSFSICFASPSGSPRSWGCAIAAVLLMAAIAFSGTAAKKPSDPEDLFNPLLGIDYSHWLVGPIATIASEEEIAEYLQLTDDEAAERFIAAFWERRNAGTEFFQKTPQQIYESRLLEADKRFTEAAYPGRRTDRGTIFVVFGEPESIEFESPQRVEDPILEIWRYPKDAAEGLGKEKPKRIYRFFKHEELTVFYTGQKRAPRPRDRQRF